MTQAESFLNAPRVPLPGSEKAPFAPSPQPADQPAAVGGKPALAGTLPAVAASKPSAPRGSITVTVVLKAATALPAIGKKRPAATLSQAAFKTQYGPARDSARIVRAFAQAFGLTVAPGAGPHLLQLSGSAAAMQKAFGVTLSLAPGSGYRVREGAILLPEPLLPHIQAVLGLDNRPQAQAHFRVRPAARAQGVSYTPVQVAQLYNLPAGATATGQTIGIIELGGGFRATDLKAYFASLNLPVPAVSAVAVDKGKNKPGNANGADGEVMLDIEVCGAVAVGAKIVVYFAPNTDQGFIDAIATAVHDTKNKPGVISISWGGPESSWTGQAMTALDAACQAAAALGVSITVACGDNGSTDGGTGNTVDFPASSPHVLACGGTKLTGSGTAITDEVVWNELAANEGATGGGVSAVFARPAWQSAANVPAPPSSTGGRGVPDVAGNADPATGYVIRVDGQTQVIGGTSAVAPLWAALIAVANAANKKAAGFLNPVLYTAGGGKAFRDITSGNNGAFQAAPGWDACTGLGSPDAAALIKLLV